jgi:hypothetical protein
MKLPRSELIARFLLVGASVSLALLAVEVFLRVDNRQPPLDLTRVELNGRTYAFHETESALANYENAVVFLGDSFTAGWNCSIPQTFTSRFGELIEAQSQRHGVNMGVPGYDGFNYLTLGRDLLAEAKPAHVVIVLYLNDMEPGCEMCRYLGEVIETPDGAATPGFARASCERCGMAPRAAEAGTAQSGTAESRTAESGTGESGTAESAMARPNRAQGVFRRIHRAISGRSLTYLVLKDAVAISLMRLGVDLQWGQTAYPGWWRLTDEGHFRLLAAGLTLLKRDLQSAGVGLTVLIYPDPTALIDSNPYVDILEGAASALEQRLGVTVRSGYSAFLGNEAAESDMYHSIADRHPSCAAHRLFGEWAYAVVSEDLRRAALQSTPALVDR